MNHRSNKKKLAVSISMVWAIRNIIHSGLLEKLVAGFDVLVVFRKPSPELEALCREKGAQAWVAPQVKAAGGYGALHRRAVDWLNLAHKLRHDLGSEEMKKGVARRELAPLRKARLELRDGLLKVLGKSSFYTWMVKLERWLYYRSHDLGALRSFLASNRIDLFLFTAPFQQEGGEVHWMRACRELGVGTVAMVLGFDNLTTKGRLPEFTDHYLVWNEIMRSEVPRIYPNVDPAHIHVTGSPQFDFYAHAEWGYSREVFCRKMNLDPGRPIILYAANPEFLVPGEQDLVADLAMRMSEDDELKNIQLILRLHPFESSPARWKEAACLPLVTLSVPWQADEGGSWGMIEQEDVHLLAGALKHAFCNINVSSTMSLDAVFHDRPVICPAYALNSHAGLSQYMRDLYDREHFLPITYSGAIRLVDSPEALLAAVKAAQRSPGECRPQRDALTRKMLGRPIGSASTEITNVLRNL